MHFFAMTHWSISVLLLQMRKLMPREIKELSNLTLLVTELGFKTHDLPMLKKVSKQSPEDNPKYNGSVPGMGKDLNNLRTFFWAICIYLTFTGIFTNYPFSTFPITLK
jgi:hypothetical protein